MSQYFKPASFIRILDKAGSTIIGCINSATEGNGAVNIRASKKGVTINLNGKLLAKGKTATELQNNFEKALEGVNKAPKSQP